MIHENFSDWCHGITGGAFASEIAKRIGVPGPTVSGWIRNNNPSFNGVLKIAIAYKVNPFKAFVEAGLIEREYLDNVDNLRSLRDISNKDLLEELLRREIRHEIRRDFVEESIRNDIKEQIKQELLSELRVFSDKGYLVYSGKRQSENIITTDNDEEFFEKF